jgi:hypothetical protein
MVTTSASASRRRVGKEGNMTPSEFLERVFLGMFGATERPAITHQLLDGRQPASPWPDTAVTPAFTHFSVGMFRHNVDAEPFTRRFDRCTGVVGLLLDDVIEKCAPPKLEPTVIVATKEVSQQWLFLFREPLSDLDAAAQAMDTLIAAGHADAGGSAGKTASIRLGRLPGSDPKNRNFRAQVVHAAWNRRFLPDIDLLFGPKGFNLSLPPKRHLTASTGNVHILKAADDDLVTWLSLNGWIRGAQTSTGWLPVRCPWSHEHTNGVETGTDVFIGKPYGFNCFHSSCRDRRPIDAFIHWASLGAPLAPLPGDQPRALPRLAWRLQTGLLDPAKWHERRTPLDALRAAYTAAKTGMDGPAIAACLTDPWSPQEAAAIAHHAESLLEARYLYGGTREAHEHALRLAETAGREAARWAR